jgi:hypothetical protein
MRKFKIHIIYFLTIIFIISISDGKSYQYQNLSTIDSIKIFNLAVRDSELILTSNFGIYISTDSGNSWTNINYNCEDVFTQDTSYIYYIRIIKYNEGKSIFVWGSNNYIYSLSQYEKAWSRYDYFKNNNNVFEDIIEFKDKFIASTLDSGLFISENLIDWKKLNNFESKYYDHFFINNGNIYLNNIEFNYTIKGNIIDGNYTKFYTPKNTAGYFVFDDSMIYISSKTGIFLSSNAGNGWEDITFTLSESMNKTYMFPLIFFNKFLYCCLDDGIYIFLKSENSWLKIFSLDNNQRFLAWNMVVINNTIIVVSLKYGLFYSSNGINFYKLDFNISRIQDQ